MARYTCGDCDATVIFGKNDEDQSAATDIAIELHKLNHTSEKILKKLSLGVYV